MAPVVIIGAGPAGAAAALELSQHGADVVLLEAADRVGGLSRTDEFRGARFDIGPHRFFTKNREIQQLWRDALGADFRKVDRLTRIFYGGKLFSYPISVGDTLKKVGPLKAAEFFGSYLAARLRVAVARREPTTFEQWVTDQFGRSLFEAFFQTYTEKVWGIPCAQISAEWAAQRIKGLSLAEAVRNALFQSKSKAKTLVEQFEYPRLGAGTMYERMVELARDRGAELLLRTRAVKIRHEHGRAVAVVARSEDGEREIPCSHVLTSNPITEAALSCDPAPPAEIAEAAGSLRFRCHLSVHLLAEGELFADQWIYVHAKEVVLGRVANYANFSADMCATERSANASAQRPAMSDQRTTAGETPAPPGTSVRWPLTAAVAASPITVEYFQFPDDALYANPSDEAVIEHATRELQLMGIMEPDQVIDGSIVRSRIAYPVMEIGYLPHLEKLRAFLETIDNLQPIGRGGMFKYNNQDHSIATGLLAARNVLGAEHNVWDVNIDAEYHEAGKAE